MMRRRKAEEEFVPEEDEESDEDESEGEQVSNVDEPKSVEEIEAGFLRKIHERFIYGLLDVSLNAYCMFSYNISNIASLSIMTPSTGMTVGTKHTMMMRNAGLTMRTPFRAVVDYIHTWVSYRQYMLCMYVTRV